jgi:hypothetical protein
VSSIHRIAGRGLSGLVLACVLLLPSVTIADSTGVPFVAGTWRGTLKSQYFDQSVAGSLHPKNKFKTKVTVTIAQTGDGPELAAMITYDDGLPTSSNTTIGVSALNGFVGNFHLSLANTGPAWALSGSVNNKANTIELRGVMANDTLTHEIDIHLKKQNN